MKSISRVYWIMAKILMEGCPFCKRKVYKAKTWGEFLFHAQSTHGYRPADVDNMVKEVALKMPETKVGVFGYLMLWLGREWYLIKKLMRKIRSINV